VLNGEVSCAVPNCECAQPVGLRNIFELYAFLYRLLDNLNYTDYETICGSHPAEAKAALTEVEALWAAHMEAIGNRYRDAMQLQLAEETEALFSDLIESAASSLLLLLRLMSFLRVLDEWLIELREDIVLYRPERIPFRTVYGDVIPQRGAALLRALTRHPLYKPPVDPNYLLLSKRVRSFHVTKSSYSYYEVKHVNAKLPIERSIERVLELSVGFLPGKWELSRDYEIVVDERPDERKRLPFRFSGVKSAAAYAAKVTECFGKLLSQTPDIVMLPELFTPPELREELRSVAAAEAARRRGMERERRRTSLILTGSFHEERDGKLYNVGEVLGLNGRGLTDVYKMNQFILQADDRLTGELAPFRKVDGVEKNAYDRRELTLLETDLGRIAILICVDFLTSDLKDVLIDRQVDLIFVMSMTPNPAGGKFIRQMQEFAERNGAAVFVCNQLGTGPDPEGKLEARVVVSLPGFRDVFVAGCEREVYRIGEILEQLEHVQKEKEKERVRRSVRQE